ncbi:tectonic-1 [Plodia interpunctella]|uniref:tectonic-1 n=1 Tax=Plodia interpunctella TaxID=58824 RepID=UPI0023680552|nr:tectonic-1 [Plodia interpunctella]
MRGITYCDFALVVILVQFIMGEFTEGKIKVDADSNDLTISSLNDDEQPHALYYRSLASTLEELSTTEYLNVSLLQTTTDTTMDLTTTIIDVLYDENTSLVGTTDVTFTTTEFENVTEISLFDNKNQTNVKPNITPKNTIITEDCNCNLLFKICDINCCCDNDCTDSDLKMFKCGEITEINQDDSCLSHLPWQRHYGNKVIDLFCIAKTNLPERRNINREKIDHQMLDRVYKWHSEEKDQSPKTFKRNIYIYGDHVWVLKNGSIKYMDLPIPVFNDYCTGRKPVTFLKEETIKCNVKLKDLEMFEIIKASREATLVSVIASTSSTATLNCSTLYCTNWTVVVCEGAECVNYNKSIHEPSCTDINCTNLALDFDYIFYYHDSKILNATIKLYTRKISSIMPFMTQKINVRFVIANETISNIVRLSGNPGYLDGLPIIVSYLKENHTKNFYNNTSPEKYIVLPENHNGMCKITNNTNKHLTFNTIKRIKCRFQYDKTVKIYNDTNVCNDINKDILGLLGINKSPFVSPFGNPINLNDNDWIPLLNDVLNKESIYGEYNEKRTKLHCYNMITGMSYIFTFADIGENNKQKMKILTGKINLVAGNVTFNIEDLSMVLTIDTMYIDETKPCLYEYAAGPHLNIRLPKDFFFPFHDNSSNNLKCNVVISVFIVFIIQQIK